MDNFAWTPDTPPEPEGWNVVKVDGKDVTADHDTALAWCQANSVALSDFAGYYDDYLLNEAPGAGGGIELAGIVRDDAAGTLTVTVARTKDCFGLDTINGRIVLYATASLGAAFEPVAAGDVTIAAEAATASVSIAIPDGSAYFFKVKVE